eukprot:gene1911-1051_t
MKQELPDEMLWNIFSYLNLKEISKVSQVSRRYSRLCDEDDMNILFSTFNQTISFTKKIKQTANKEISGWRRFLDIFGNSDFRFHFNNMKNPERILLGNSHKSARCTMRGNVTIHSTEKLFPTTTKYFEFKIDSKSSTWNIGIGLERDLHSDSTFVGFNKNSWSYASSGYIRARGGEEYLELENYPRYKTGDVVSLLLDLPMDRVFVFLNSKFIYEFQNVISTFKNPLYLACTLHDPKDQITLIQENFSIDPSIALKYYRKIEQEQLKSNIKDTLNEIFFELQLKNDINQYLNLKRDLDKRLSELKHDSNNK